MLPDTGIDDVKKQRNAEYAKHINDPVLSSLKMEGIRLIFLWLFDPISSHGLPLRGFAITLIGHNTLGGTFWAKVQPDSENST
jgi:hypothetical protein